VVQRYDSLMQQRVQAIAAEKGLDATTLLPEQTLRDEAIGTGDLGSPPAQALVAEYLRIFEELGAGPPGAAPAPSPSP